MQEEIRKLVAHAMDTLDSFVKHVGEISNAFHNHKYQHCSTITMLDSVWNIGAALERVAKALEGSENSRGVLQDKVVSVKYQGGGYHQVRVVGIERFGGQNFLRLEPQHGGEHMFVAHRHILSIAFSEEKPPATAKPSGGPQ